MSVNPASDLAVDEDQSSSSDGGVDGTNSHNVYTSSPNSTPPPPTCDDIDRWHYHVDLEKFGQSLQAAAKAVFPNDRRSRYADVSVLMLSWADEDPKLPVSQEIDKLQLIFQNVYRFDTEHWEIPSQQSHYKTNERVMEFVKPRDDSTTHLKIVYYAGHARLMETRALALTSWQNNKKSKPPTVKWSAIQTLLEEDPSDVLILLDCCASGTANACEGAGVNELISACAWNETANGVGPYSFTSALVIELKRLSQKPSFSVGELYRNIFWRTQSRMPEDERQEGRERERHPAPIHLVLTQDAVPRSIQLSVHQDRSRNAVDRNQREKTPEQVQKNPKLVGSESVPQLTVSRHPTEDENMAKTSPQHSKKQAIIDPSKVPRLAFAIRLHDTFKPSDDLKDLFLQWLRDMPNIAQQVKIEAGFDAFSTLVVVSLPIALSAYLPRDPAIISLGPITSGNRVSPNTSSIPVRPPSESLSSMLPPMSQAVNTQSHPLLHSVGSELTQAIPYISPSEEEEMIPEIFVDESSRTDNPSQYFDLSGLKTDVPTIVPQFAQGAMTTIPDGESMHAKYSTVSVLLLSWEADNFDKMMQKNQNSLKSRLADVFRRIYGFEVERWIIPDLNSHDQLATKVSLMPNTGSHLNIIYYMGHSELTPGDVVWRSYASSSQNAGPVVHWSKLQESFITAHSDTLLLLDCFAEPASPSLKYFGVTELIAADWKKKGESKGQLFYFTEALIKGLCVFAKKDSAFTIKALASFIYTELDEMCKKTAILDQFRLTYSGRATVRLCSAEDADPHELPPSLHQKDKNAAMTWGL